MSTTTVTSDVIRYERTLGMTVMTGKGFYAPNDLSCGPNGRIYVLNRSIEAFGKGNGMRVAICDSDDEYYGQFGNFGEGKGQFVWPSAIACSDTGEVYIADEYLQKIMTFDLDGKFVSEWGSHGSNNGEFDTPSGIVVADNGYLYVSDTYNHRIQVLTSNGKFVQSFGSKGNGNGELNMPWRLSIGPDSNVYVADWGNDRISIFTLDGDYVKSIGESGSGPGKLCKPADTVSDLDGNIYVCDWGNERIQVFDSNGKFLQLNMGESGVSPWAQNFLRVNDEESNARDTANLENLDIPFYDPDDRHEVSSHIEKYFWAPMALHIYEDNKLFVLESNRHRIQIFDIVNLN